MENLFVTIPIEIAKDSDVYKAAEEFSKQNGDLEVFSSPEKVLEHCITFGMFPPYIEQHVDVRESCCCLQSESQQRRKII